MANAAEEGDSPLVHLLLANESGALRSVEGGGFIDSTLSTECTNRSKKLCGVYRFLHCKTSAFPSMSRKQYRAGLTSETRQMLAKQRRANGGERVKFSTKRTGQYFHRQVYHATVCAPLGECSCPEGETKCFARKDSPAYGMIRAAISFLDDFKLTPLCGETIVTAPRYGLGTRIDLLCCRADHPSRNVLVSWKTTGACPFRSGERSVSIERVCARRRSDEATEVLVSREHLAQLACELHMLSDEHSVPIHEAHICYLSPGTQKYRAVSLDGSSVEGKGYARVWDWIAARRLREPKKDPRFARRKAPSSKAKSKKPPPKPKSGKKRKSSGKKKKSPAPKKRKTSSSR